MALPEAIQAAVWILNNIGVQLIIIFAGVPFGFWLLGYLVENIQRVLATIKFW